MSRTTADWRGIIVELDNDETSKLLQAMSLGSGTGGAGAIAAALGSLAIPALPASIIAGALAIHLVWEAAAINAANKGDGVILTFLYGAPGVAIPSTRIAPNLDPEWVTRVEGIFVSPAGDRVTYRVAHNAVDEAGVVFRLVNQSPSGWDKSFVLRDGQGSQWEVRSTVSAAGVESLWAGQVKLGQQITFRKPAFAGIWVDAFSVGGLGALQPGDEATFVWVE